MSVVRDVGTLRPVAALVAAAGMLVAACAPTLSATIETGGDTEGTRTARPAPTATALAVEVPDDLSLWRCPVRGRPEFRHDFGVVNGEYHRGIDLYAYRGTPVLAPVDGTVEHLEGSVGGRQFVLHGDDGRTYIGSHLERLGAEGRVLAGDVVGAVGTSGNAVGSSPHLHFEVHEDGEPIDPFPLLDEHCR